MLVIRKTMSATNAVEIKYSFTNANLEQYTHQSLAYMQAQRFFVEHCIKESKQILGLHQFQTRKWLAWQHQVAFNFLVSFGKDISQMAKLCWTKKLKYAVSHRFKDLSAEKTT